MYYLFGGEYYYATGGANDFIVKSQDLDDLTMLAVDKITGNEIDWFHITNEDMDIVCGTRVQAHGKSDLPVGNDSTFCYNRKDDTWYWD